MGKCNHFVYLLVQKYIKEKRIIQMQQLLEIRGTMEVYSSHPMRTCISDDTCKFESAK